MKGMTGRETQENLKWNGCMGADGRRYTDLLDRGGGTEPLTSLDGTAHSCAHKPPRDKLLMAGVPERELYIYTKL